MLECVLKCFPSSSFPSRTSPTSASESQTLQVQNCTCVCMCMCVVIKSKNCMYLQYYTYTIKVLTLLSGHFHYMVAWVTHPICQIMSHSGPSCSPGPNCTLKACPHCTLKPFHQCLEWAPCDLTTPGFIPMGSTRFHLKPSEG